jgi:hypothetical protein
LGFENYYMDMNYGINEFKKRILNIFESFFLGGSYEDN